MVRTSRPPDSAGARLLAIAVVVTAAAGCGGAGDELVRWIETSADHPLAPLGVIAIFIASGFVAAPLSLIMIPTIVVYGPALGTLWTVIGATLSGVLFFWLGARGATVVGRFRRDTDTSSRLGRLMGDNGIVAVAIARNLPLGPYPVVNLALGASPVRLPQFVIGNLIGLAPWIALYAVTGAEVRALIADPSPSTWLRAAAVLAVVAVVSLLVSRKLRRGAPAADADGPAR
jgi:uncharacterized membrane protein YdjX (TVP38/TMEM64 family)